MGKAVIVYWSGTGNTQAMAEAIWEGAKESNPSCDFYFVSDITASHAAAYDVLILGCPAMGAEVLEEEDFEPFFAQLEASLAGKQVALFGSYGWGDGEWMRAWEERVRTAGAVLFENEGLMINEAPDDTALAQCREFGKKAAAL